MKKGKVLMLMILVVTGIILLTACSNNGNSQIKESGEGNITIGISQLAEHPALDDARKGFEDGLKELGVNANIVYQNAQGDIPTSGTIAQKFVKDRVDLIFAIATPAAQSAKQATSDIPIIFSAVTDPVDAGLIDSMENPGGNITGTSDLSPMDKQLQLFRDLKEDIKDIGIIYNTSEPNSQVQVEMAKTVAKDLGLEIIEMGISNINDIPQAMDSILKKVDGIYTITDNMVANAINVVANKAIENNILTVGAEDAHVKGGILITDGISYYELGKQSARMAKDILIGGKSPANLPAEISRNTKKVFNEDVLKALGLDINIKAFQDAKRIEN